MRWRSAAAGRRDVHVVLSLFLSAAMVHVIFFSCKQQATITLEKGISFLCDLKKPITIRHRVAPSRADCWILSSESGNLNNRNMIPTSNFLVVSNKIILVVHWSWRKIYMEASLHLVIGFIIYVTILTIHTNTRETTNFSTAQTPRFHIPTQHTALPSWEAT